MNRGQPGGYRLFGSLGSGSAAVELALRRIGAPFELVRASTWEPDSARDALAAVNPLRQIPTLVLPDGSVMTESAAILIELALRHPDAGLLPPGPAARAHNLRGLVFIAANCYANIGIIDYPERWLPQARAPARERLRDGARARLHRAWEVFADQFDGTPWLAGPAPGALDFLCAVVSRWSGARAHLAQARPALAALVERVQAEPELAPVFQRHWP